uniref:Abasic site processing protein HMCES n=1 Tax=Trichuris muris TaxID=70415 RepID=A0A5S6Q7K4_TRIMR
MCGRYVCWLAAEGLCDAARFRRGKRTYSASWYNDSMKSAYRPSYNRSPGSAAAVLVSSDGLANEPVRETSDQQMSLLLVQMDWGVEPSWSGAQHDHPIINARAESIVSKPFFKQSVARGRRCVVLTQGFYEWQKTSSGKQPYFIYMPTSSDEESKGESNVERNCKLMPLAGLYFPQKEKNTGCSFAFVIITVDAVPSIDFIHDRMPAILDTDEAVLDWLDCEQFDSDEVVKYLRPCQLLSYHSVSKRVNGSTYDDSQNIQPFQEGNCSGERAKRQASLKSFFSPKKEKLA